MRKILITAAIIFIAFNTRAQLVNTKWKGTLNVENGLDAVFNFHNDTLVVSSAESGEDLETMSYNTTDSVLTLIKLYGQSQCDTTSGKYKYAIENNELTLSLIADGCPDRSQAIGTMKLEKVD
ncbi:MAG TPA: hypothetical protein VFT78_12150 [Hanamia sp.]|nr:hypothetical protein [Hanamia sp.]